VAKTLTWARLAESTPQPHLHLIAAVTRDAPLTT
jgi:hypothetical protein